MRKNIRFLKTSSAKPSFRCRENKPAPKNIIEAPELRVYIQDLGRRRDDFCLCAESEGRVIGAAWARLSTGFGRIDDQTPELAVSVLKAHRGRGVGSALLRALIARLRRAGFAQVSLSVQKANPAVRPLPPPGLLRRLRAGRRTCHDSPPFTPQRDSYQPRFPHELL